MKKIVALSAITALALTAGAADTTAEEIAKLKEELSTLKKTLTDVKIHTAGDNIKFSANLRTAIDSIETKRASGAKDKNPDLMTSRLLLGMAAMPTDNMIFKGTLSYNKAFGAAPANPNNDMGMPQRGYGYDTFDWVVNENLIDNSLRVKEAYWLYRGNFGTPFTASVGRRPSTDGFLMNHREGESDYKSPLGHVINVEFDGASLAWDLDQATGVNGMSFKLCLGRGLTNARGRFNMDGGLTSHGDYTRDNTTLKDIDMYGFIFVPYDDGQYKVATTWFRGTNVPGFSMINGDSSLDMQSTPGQFTIEDNSDGMVTGALEPVIDTSGNFQGMKLADSAAMNGNVAMKAMGDMEGAAISFQSSGIGEMFVSDFRDKTTLFASFAMSKSHPGSDTAALNMRAFDSMKGTTFAADGGAVDTVQEMIGQMDQNSDGTLSTAELEQAGIITNTMLGSTDSETGTSFLIGATFPTLVSDGKVGVEYNQGSEYWRPFTYGEDTLVASKMAARGSAWEVYYNEPLIEDVLRMQLRYTSISYDYTGSQAFFGDDGMPMKISEAKAMGMDPIESATDLRFSITYNY